jgi:beta-fructofuranosidase
VLIISLWRKEGTGRSHAGVSYLLGDLVLTDDLQLRFHPTSQGTLDTGAAFYAPQAATTDDRVLLWGWICELRDDAEAAAAGWAGALTHPRELAVHDGRLISRPAAELAALIGPELPASESITTSAFLVRLSGPGSLSLDGAEIIRTDRAADVWVDGSVVECYPESGISHTTRGYPAAGSGWDVTGPARVYALELPSGDTAHPGS